MTWQIQPIRKPAARFTSYARGGKLSALAHKATRAIIESRSAVLV